MGSSVIQGVLKDFDVASVFDEVISASGDIQNIARKMNESLRDNHGAWTMVQAVGESTQRFVDAYATLGKEQQKIIVEEMAYPKVKNGEILYINVLTRDDKLVIPMDPDTDNLPNNFGAAIQEEFINRILPEWQAQKDENYKRIEDWENFPNEGSAARADRKGTGGSLAKLSVVDS